MKLSWLSVLPVNAKAMAVGVVPLVVNYAGPSELVTQKTGFLVDIGAPEKIVRQFRAVLNDLVEHPQKIDQRSAAALARAHRHFTWDAKAARIREIYDWALSGSTVRPPQRIPVPDDLESSAA